MVLPDVLAADLRVVFCGTAVGERSAERQAYYAGPGNQFWPTLYKVGLIPVKLVPEEYATLPIYGIGLTDLVKISSGSDQSLLKSHYDVPGFRAKIEACAPRAVAFNGKKAAETALGRSVRYGKQSAQIGTSEVWVLPSTSGAARGFWDVTHWQRLADYLQKERP